MVIINFQSIEISVFFHHPGFFRSLQHKSTYDIPGLKGAACLYKSLESFFFLLSNIRKFIFYLYMNIFSFLFSDSTMQSFSFSDAIINHFHFFANALQLCVNSFITFYHTLTHKCWEQLGRVLVYCVFRKLSQR